MDEYTYSVIIPVYNTEKYIESCINSVIGQRETSYEIIIVNDGSTDSSEIIIRSLIEKHPEVVIKYIKQKNSGLSEARNVGLKMATGKYIIWLDSDDALRNGAFAQLNNIVGKEPDVIVNRIASYNEKTGEVSECRYKFESLDGLLNRDRFIKILESIEGFWYAAWCFVPKRELLINTGLSFKKDIYHEDELWSPQLICLGKSFCCNPEYYYLNTSLREGSIITKKNIRKEFHKLQICDELKKFKGSVAGKRESRFIGKRICIILYTVYAAIEYYSDDGNIKKLRFEFFLRLREIYRWKWLFILLMYKVRSLLK